MTAASRKPPVSEAPESEALSGPALIRQALSQRDLADQRARAQREARTVRPMRPGYQNDFHTSAG